MRVALIFGGTSQERAVSLVSVKAAAAFLDDKKYEVIPVEIDERGKWLLNSPTIKQVAKKVRTTKVFSKELVPVEKDVKGKIDVALLILHGPGGEDGTIQGMLDLLRIPYTGSGVLGSALAMDKARTKKFLASEGIPVLPHIVLTRDDIKSIGRKHLQSLHRTVVIKPNRLGSSIGVTIARDKKTIKKGILEALKHTDEVIIEPFVEGREITVPVLGNKDPEVLPTIEIIPWKRSAFYDYKAKYETGGSEHVIPANLTKPQEQEVKELALRVHVALGCRGVTRSDFILDKKGQFFFLEINTIPGMTPTSLVPQSAGVRGISYSELLDRLIKLAREK